MRRVHVTPLLLVVALVLGAGSPSLGAGPFAPPMAGSEGRQKGRVILRADPTYVPLRVLPMHRPGGLGAQSAAFAVNWMEGKTNGWGDLCGTWPAGARTAFLYALSIWTDQIVSSQPIEIEACWTPMGPSVLGAAGPADFDRDFAEAPRPRTWYPVALINDLVGSDWNDVDGWDSNEDGLDHDPEIEASLSSDFGSWYLGTDGNVPSGKYDLVSVVLHEVCHGLGFIGTMEISGGSGRWGWNTPYPIVFDHFLKNGSGQSLLDTGLFPNPSVALGDQLRGLGGGVYLDGPNANAGNGGARVPLYAPFTWDPGSSIYHVGTVYDGTINGLMTHSLSSGEAQQDPGPVTRGILRDLGWRVSTLPDLSIAGRVVGPAEPRPGDPVILTLTIANAGVYTATGVLITDTVPAQILSPTYEPSTSLSGLSAAGGTTFEWSLPELVPGASGVITIYGTLDAALPDDYAVWNMATVSAPGGDDDLGNNRTVMLLGGDRAFLPLAVKSFP